MCVVSISNKKGDDLRDPQNNTTKRFNIIKEKYGSVVKSVVKSIDEGIEVVSDVKKHQLKAFTNVIDIDENIIKVCELPQMKKYIEKLDENAKFEEYVENKGKSIGSLDIGEKLKLTRTF